MAINGAKGNLLSRVDPHLTVRRMVEDVGCWSLGPVTGGV